MDAQTISHIRERIERCRRLAKATTDDDVAAALLQMAQEGEADLLRLEGGQSTGSNELPPTAGA